MSDQRPLIIVGASTRAAAQSAIRSGFEPYCADQFADDDLRECSQILPLTEFPHGLLETLAQAPEAQWLYTGGLENQPELVARLSEWRPLAGCGAETLRQVRDPEWIAAALAERQIPALPISLDRPGDNEHLWLRKPLASAGGLHIDVANSAEHANRPSYYQRFVAGPSLSGLFLADGCQSVLIGISQQLVGEPVTGASRFGYSGSIAPLSSADLPESCQSQLAQLGAVLTQAAGLRGLFGLDVIWDEPSRTVWLLEVNPRYPASTELYELALQIPLMKWHVELSELAAASEDERGKSRWNRNLQATTDAPRTAVWGKLVLYAIQQTVIGDSWRHDVEAALGTRARLADIPTPGSVIPPGIPVCTVLTQAPTPEDCRRELMATGTLVRQHLRSA